MGLVDSERDCSPLLALEVDSGTKSSGEGESNRGLFMPSQDDEWHSIPLEDLSKQEMECCLRIIDGNQSSNFSKKNLSMCGLSNCLGDEGNDDDETEKLVKYPTALRNEFSFGSTEATTGEGGMREVRVSFHGLKDGKKSSDGVNYLRVENTCSETEYRDDGCVPILHQLRALVKGVKLSFGGLLSGDSKTLAVDGWSSFLDRNVFSKSSQGTASVASEEACKKGNGPSSVRSAPADAFSVKIQTSGITDTSKPNPLQARDLQSRADSLPLAHYRPTDGPSWKDGETKGSQSPPSVAPSKSIGTCKKPPKPPKYPVKSASLESGTNVSQRSVKKLKDRVSSKRKTRAAAAAVSSGVTPVIALVLTLGFGLLMVFQGVFVQSNVAYGKNADRAFVDTAADVKMSFPKGDATHGFPYHEIDPHLLASVNVDAIRSQAAVSKAFNKSMKDLPWSRNSLTWHVKTGSG